MKRSINGLELGPIESLIGLEAFPGCSLALSVAPGDLQTAAWGKYGAENSQKVTPDTIYDLASVTKLFTTALVLRLHQGGRLSIDDPVGRFLENFAHSDIKIVDLLTHKVNFGIRLSTFRQNPSSFAKKIESFTPPPTSSPEVHYANLGFIYLGRIVEQVENASLNTAMRRLIADLSLTQTVTGPDLRQAGVNPPPTGITEKGVIHDESARLLGGMAGNAGIFASAGDLALFGRAWLAGRIVDHRFDNLVFDNYGSNTPQALGWWLRVPTEGGWNTPGIYSHTGFTGPLLAINPANLKVCAFVCNRTWHGRDNQKHKRAWRLLVNWLMS